MNSDFYTIDDLTKELGFSKSTQSTMRRDKLIPYNKIGNKVFYNRIEIKKWITNNGGNQNARQK